MEKLRFAIAVAAISIFILSCFFPLVIGQQPYVKQLTAACENTDNSTSVLGYTCNGLRRSCQSYLTFRSEPPYTSVAAISSLLAVNSTQLAQLNSVPENSVFEPGRVVLVPATCSCSGQLYQANATYAVRSGDTYFTIANNTFQGLSTCQALQAQNDIPARDLFVGARLRVPLRCACPTQSQLDDGVNFLLSYLVTWNEFVETIGVRFGVRTAKILSANGLSETDDLIFPFTTLVVPLEEPPTSSLVTAPQPPPPPSVTPLPTAPPSGGGSSKAWIFAVVGALGGLLALVLIAVFVYKRRKRAAEPLPSKQKFESAEKPLKKAGDDEGGDDNGDDSHDFLESISSIAQSLKVYPFHQLREATEDFGTSSLIKGSVYRGTINGDFAAIKKMSGGDVSKEISLLNKINHSNLIRLSGVSFNEGIWYLVYEYAPNGALVDWIRNNGNDQEVLNWDKRLQIAVDVAAGLNYLHRYTSPPHIHKDLNSSNVLLDGEFRAKIANFGLAREGEEGGFALTRHIVGTKGYMAPEYLENGIVSPKLDVYSYGVLLLEILTGKQVDEEAKMKLAEVLSEGGEGNIGNLMDTSLMGKYPSDLALVLFRLIDGCLKKEPSARPNMDEILQTLSRISGEWAVSISESGVFPR